MTQQNVWLTPNLPQDIVTQQNVWLTHNLPQDIVTQQNVWLTDELTAKTNELAKLRQSSTEITCKLKSELAHKSEDSAFLNVSGI